MSQSVQSVLLRRENFTPDEAMAWIHEHGYIATKIYILPNYYIFKQQDAQYSNRIRYKTISIGNDGYIITMLI